MNSFSRKKCLCVSVFVVLSIFLENCQSASIEFVTKKSLLDNSFWNKTISELWGQSRIECANQVFPLKALIDDQKIQDDFSECSGDLTSSSPMDKLCISALYNIQYVCKHEVQALSQDQNIPVSELLSHSASELCAGLTSNSVPIPTCHDVPCNQTSQTGFELRHPDEAKQYCDACQTSPKSKLVCRHLLFTYKAINILNGYVESGDKKQAKDVPVAKADVGSNQNQDTIVKVPEELPNQERNDEQQKEGVLEKVEAEKPDENIKQEEQQQPSIDQPNTDVNNTVDSTTTTTTEIITTTTTTKITTPTTSTTTTSTTATSTTTTNNNNESKTTSLPPKPKEKEIDQSEKIAADDDDEEIFGEDNAEKIDNVEIEKNLEEPDLNNNIGSRKKAEQDDKPVLVDHLSNRGHLDEPNNNLGYFLLLSVLAVFLYLIFHNKKKIMALIVEGRRGQTSKGRRRTSSAQYRKLDNNLEEAMGPNSNDSVRHVIY